MECSLNSLTFKGSISEAIVEAQEKKKLFVVYISGNDENSVLLEQSTWKDLNVADLISRLCVLLHLIQGSVDASYFCAMYPQKASPSISAIGYNGTLLWQHEGDVAAEVLVAGIQQAWTNLHLQESAAALLATALVSNSIHPDASSETFSAHEIPLLAGSTTVESSSDPSSSSQIIGESQIEELREEKVIEDKKERSQLIDTNDLQCHVSDVTEQCFSRDGTAKPDHGSDIGSRLYAERDISSSLEEIASINVCCEMGKETEFGPSSPQIVADEVANDDNNKRTEHAIHKTKLKSNDAYLNIRMPNGFNLHGKFVLSDTLGLVKEYVDVNRQNWRGAYDLASPYPRRVFTEEDMKKTLSELGLFNRETLIIVPRHSVSSFSAMQSSVSNEPVHSDNNNGGLVGFIGRMFSYINPFSYFRVGTSSSSSETVSSQNSRQYTPTSSPEKSGQTNRKKTQPRFASGSNIHTLKHDEDDNRFKGRNAFWNGNSTQYGGDDNK